MAIRNKDTAYQKSVDNIFQVSVSANKETYKRLMKEREKRKVKRTGKGQRSLTQK